MTWWSTLTVVDMTILGTLLVAFLIGWVTGLIRFLTGFLSFIIAVVVAGRYSGAVTEWLDRAFGAQAWMEGVLARRINLPAEASQVPASAVPFETALDWLHRVPVPEVYKASLAASLTTWSAAADGKTAAQFLIEQIAAGLLSALVFALMVMLISLLLGALGRLIAEQIHEIPLIGTADRLLGATALTLQTALILTIVIVFVIPTLHLFGAQELGQAVDQARTPPYLIAFFEWLQRFLFGGGTKLWNV